MRKRMSRFADPKTGKLPVLAGGDPTGDPLRKRLAQQDDAIAGLRQDAGEKWKALESAKAEVGKVDGELTEDHPAYKAMDEAGKAYGAVADKIASAEQVKSGLVDAMIASGLATVEESRGRGGDDRDERRAALAKSAGARIVESDEYRALLASGAAKPGSKANIGVHSFGEAWSRDEVKAALITGASDTSAGALVQPDRVGYFPLPLRPITLLDLITLGDTDSDMVEYVRMTSFTNAAAETAEASGVSPSGRKPEASMQFEIVQEGVSTIAHWVPATKRALSDAGQLRTIIDSLLRYGLDRRLEDQVVAGDGTGENLLGILNLTGTNSVPAGAKTHADKVHNGITQIRLDNVEPTGVAINPLDWEPIRLSRDDSGAAAGTGGYLFGPPSTQGAQTLWGLPVAVTAAVPQGTAIVGDFRAYVLWMREGAQVLASDSHEDFFVRNMVAILAELRAAGGAMYPQSFAEVNLAAA